MKDMVCLGEIVGTHGVKGELKINSFTEEPMSLTAYGELADESGKVYALTPRFAKGTVVVAACDGVANPEDGKALRGTKLYVPRANLPESDDGIYIEDLVGLPVQTPEGEKLGAIHALHDFGAGSVVEITFDGGKREMFAFNEENFPAIDVDAGTVTFVRPDVLEAKGK